MKNKFIFLLILISFSFQAQKKEIINANQAYEKYAYIDAIKIYKKVVEKGFFSKEILEKLANSYYFNADYIKASNYYKLLLETNVNVNPEYFYRYAQSLKSIQNYELSSTMMNQFVLKSKLDKRASLFKESENYLDLILKNSGKFEVKNTENNSRLSDYGTAFFENKIIFASTRDSVSTFSSKHSWNNQPFSNLYIADIQDDGKLNNSRYFAKELNTQYHESTPIFTKDGKTMYFTRNDFKKGKVCKDKNSNFLLSIYRVTFENGKWGNELELPFNGDDFMTAHPALSNDDKILYFTSNRDYKNGFSDLYKVEILENNQFGTPVNLGNTINTNSRETFPFISKDNYLYFASDGFPGLGGLDVYASKINEDGTFQKPFNLGKPINTDQDDFAFIIDSETKKGYLSSNRKIDSYGDDDIYFINQIESFTKDCFQNLEGFIMDKDKNTPVSNAKITLLSADKTKINEIFTDNKGFYSFNQQECNSLVFIYVSKPNYLTFEELVELPKSSGKTTRNLVIENQIKKVTIGDDLSKTLNINKIYFDLDKHNIREDAATELSKILIVIQENSSLKIDIRSHTDSRNTIEYNQKLSQRRARSTMNWLVKNGINQNRLTARGFGEEQLINNCSDGVNCTEEEHQNNRRSEFIIVSID